MAVARSFINDDITSDSVNGLDEIRILCGPCFWGSFAIVGGGVLHRNKVIH